MPCHCEFSTAATNSTARRAYTAKVDQHESTQRSIDRRSGIQSGRIGIGSVKTVNSNSTPFSGPFSLAYAVNYRASGGTRNAGDSWHRGPIVQHCIESTTERWAVGLHLALLAGFSRGAKQLGQLFYTGRPQRETRRRADWDPTARVTRLRMTRGSWVDELTVVKRLQRAIRPPLNEN